MRRWWTLAALCTPLVCHPRESGDPRVLADFEDTKGWTIIQSDQVAGTLRNIDGPDGRALCLDYDFHDVSGYVGVQRDLPLDYPGNYAFAFQLKGEGRKNDLQFKLVDASGDNVWWATRPKFALPGDWTAMTFRKRHVSRAWGPSEEKTLKRSAKLEFTLASGEGGKGSVCFDALTFQALPPQDDSPLAGTLAGGGAQRTLDLGKPREIGGAILRWEGRPARYTVELSNDGATWRNVRTLENGDGGEDFLALPEAETRYIRVTQSGATLQAIEAQPLAFAATPNDFVKAVAARSPRGAYPRGFVGEQSYWTIIGLDGGERQGLLGEDGALELGKGDFSIEPEVRIGDRRVTWADVTASQALQDGYLPMPTVRWAHAKFQLSVTAFAEGDGGAASQYIARYRLTNTTQADVAYQLVLRARPFQVNAPSQFLNTVGGVRPIDTMQLAPRAISVGGWDRATLSRPADSVSVRAFDALPSHTPKVDDPARLAEGELVYDVRLAPGQSFDLDLAAPLDGLSTASIAPGDADRAQARVAKVWHDKLDRVRFRVPKAGEKIVATLRTALAHMAISRVGPRLQPGTRSYSRAWIRDGAMIGEGLLRLGRDDIARDFLRWYAPYQFKSGKVPCCVDDRGADPVPENDSHGELVFLVAEVHRFTQDRKLLEEMWPHVLGAVKYMDELRASERTPENRAKNPAFYGLMPASISHEGYSAKPMHSYWDDFWALRGYKDAVEIATWLGHDAEAKRFAAARDQFAADLHASIATAMRHKRIDFIPGSAELGDFDATSTTIALAPGGEQDALPRAALLATFERYWKEFELRRHDQREWKDYTPYELRTVGTFVRLGWRARALSALDFFFADQQPQAWNQWAEVVSRTPRKPFFLGDLPHAWVASDYVRSALDMFAYSRETDGVLVLAAGIPGAWLSGEGIAVDGLRTPGGALQYALSADDKRVRLEIGEGIEGALVLPWMFDGQPGATTIDGKPAEWKAGELRIARAPAVVEIAR